MTDSELTLIFDAFYDLNKTRSYQAGEPSRILAHRIGFYKKQIKNAFNKDPKQTFPFLIRSHSLLTIVTATTSNHSHMINDSIYFLERQISIYLKNITLD